MRSQLYLLELFGHIFREVINRQPREPSRAPACLKLCPQSLVCSCILPRKNAQPLTHDSFENQHSFATPIFVLPWYFAIRICLFGPTTGNPITQVSRSSTEQHEQPFFDPRVKSVANPNTTFVTDRTTRCFHLHFLRSPRASLSLLSPLRPRAASLRLILLH